MFFLTKINILKPKRFLDIDGLPIFVKSKSVVVHTQALEATAANSAK